MNFRKKRLHFSREDEIPFILVLLTFFFNEEYDNFSGMIGWLCLWQLFIISNYGTYEAKPVASAQPSILEVSIGETAKLHCPSNDDNHRFQFWQLKSNEILGPGNKINERKYKYEVLSGTLYIKVKCYYNSNTNQ